MTEQEFDIWLEDYMTRFPALKRLIDASPGLMTDYWEMLKSFDLAQMRRATREISTLDPTPYPNQHLGKLLRIVREIAKYDKFLEHKPQDDRPQTYRCIRCQDSGFVYVWHPLAYGPIRNEKFDPLKHTNEIVVACDCNAGIRPSQEKETPVKNGCKPLMRFCANRMLPTRDTTYKDLILFVENNYRPRNFHSEFEEFT